MTIQSRHIFIVLLIVGTLLMIPFIAMQFTPEVNWTRSDFIIAAALLFITGFSLLFVISKMRNKKVKLLAITAILFILLIIWAELAVGIFGSPFAGQ